MRWVVLVFVLVFSVSATYAQNDTPLQRALNGLFGQVSKQRTEGAASASDAERRGNAAKMSKRKKPNRKRVSLYDYDEDDEDIDDNDNEDIKLTAPLQSFGVALTVAAMSMLFLYRFTQFAGRLMVHFAWFLPSFVVCQFLMWSLTSALGRFEPFFRALAFIRNFL